jgi:hypothetical protein
VKQCQTFKIVISRSFYSHAAQKPTIEKRRASTSAKTSSMSVHDFSFGSDDRAARAIMRKPLFCNVQGGSLPRAGHPFSPDLPDDLLGWSCCPTHSIGRFIGQGRWRVAPLVVGSSTWYLIQFCMYSFRGVEVLRRDKARQNRVGGAPYMWC